MDMEIWLESLTAETVENDVTDDQGGSLPGNREETDSIIETVNPDNSVVRTTRLSSMDLFDVDASGVTAAETVAAQNDEEYNVIFCVDTRNVKTTAIFNEYIKDTIDKINVSDRPKANVYWGDDRGEVGSSLYVQRQNGAKASIHLSRSLIENFDLSNVMNTVLDNCGYNSIYSNRSELETYVFIIFTPEVIMTEAKPALELLKNINGKNIHISLISGLTTYNDDSYLINMVTRTEGTIINTNNNDANTSDEVASSVVKYIGTNEPPIKIISSYSLTPLSPLFDREYINELSKLHIENKGENSTTGNDTDSDGLRDYYEVSFESALIDLSKVDYLPTVMHCQNYASANDTLLYVKSGFDRFMGSLGGNSILLASIRILPINSDPTMPDSDGDGILDNVDIEPLYDNYNIPFEIKYYINSLYIDMNNICSTDDGIDINNIFSPDDSFLLYYTPISDILVNANVTKTSADQDVNNMYDDWYIYSINNESGCVFGLTKMREIESDNIDGDQPGVSISFIDFELNALTQCIKDEGLSIRQLDDEINSCVIGGMEYSKVLVDYFKNYMNAGSYVIADKYIEKIISLSDGKKIDVPQKVNEVYRVASLLEDINIKVGRTMYDSNS
jgi:hypothetical protein